MNRCPTYKRLKSDAAVANAKTASETVSFMLLIAVMAIL